VQLPCHLPIGKPTRDGAEHFDLTGTKGLFGGSAHLPQHARCDSGRQHRLTLGGQPYRVEEVLAAGVLQQVTRRTGLDGPADVRVRVVGGKDQDLDVLVFGPYPFCRARSVELGSDDRRCELLRIASKMHDVGKIGVPDAILLKPGKLTPEEFDTMKKHAEIGYQILHGSESELARLGAVIAWTHHEKVDGSGYPRGLESDDIPVEGRIAAVADVFDALTTDRIYRKAFSLPAALSIMREGGDQHFDADLLDLFIDSIDVVLTTKSEFDESSTRRGA